MQPQGAPQKSNTSTVLLVVLAVGGLSLICCVGTLAAIAVPNFIKFNVRARQAEARSNLKNAYLSQRSWFDEHHTYSESVEEVGFSPDRNNRYSYFFSASGDPLLPGSPDGGQHTGVAGDPRLAVGPVAALYAAIPPPLLAELGLHGKCPEECRITMVAAANLDTDSTIDLWSISTVDRTLNGEPVKAGTPYHHVDDTK